MRISMKSKLIPLLALTLLVGAFLFAGITAVYAAVDMDAYGLSATEELSVDEVWLSGDTLHMSITDKNNDERRNLAINLNDYAKSSDEYVTVQATDSSGRTSNSIQFKNPYYVKNADSGNGSDSPEKDKGISESAISESDMQGDENPYDARNDDSGVGSNSSAQNSGISESQVSESKVSGGENPFTPDGTGTVIDNAASGDGKEFFTVETPDGNVFYLILDRQRNTDNVYLLNAVTEDDLSSLAKPGGGRSVSAVETQSLLQEPAPPETAPEQAADSAPAQSGGSNTGLIVLIVIAVIAAGGAGYYFKIVRPKKQGTVYDDDYGDEAEDPGDNEEMDVTADEEDDDE